MAKPRLHLNADASRVSLLRVLLERGHDVTRTPNEWMALDATDEPTINAGFCLLREDFCIKPFAQRELCEELFTRSVSLSVVILNAHFSNFI